MCLVEGSRVPQLCGSPQGHRAFPLVHLGTFNKEVEGCPRDRLHSRQLGEENSMEKQEGRLSQPDLEVVHVIPTHISLARTLSHVVI